MSSNSIVDLTSSEPKTTIIQDETSNQSIEIPAPPTISSEKHSSSSNSDSYTDIDTDSDSDDDDDDDIPIDLTFDWLDEQMRAGNDLRPIISRIIPDLPDEISQSAMYELFMNIFLPFRQRKVLEQYKTLDDAVELIHTRKNILILTGAGISVSCGSKNLIILRKTNKNSFLF